LNSFKVLFLYIFILNKKKKESINKIQNNIKVNNYKLLIKYIINNNIILKDFKKNINKNYNYILFI
jgi:hypothetical protein